MKKLILFIPLTVLIFIVVIFIDVKTNMSNSEVYKNNKLISVIESKEFSVVSGVWKITEYLGQSVEYHGAEATTETESSKNNKIIKEKEKYLKQSFI